MSRRRQEVILALDISSSSTGYAVLRDGSWSGVETEYGVITVPTNLTFPKRLVAFRNALADVIRQTKPTHIIIEDVFRGPNVSTMKLLARFNGVAVEVSRRLLRRDPQIALAAEVRAALGCGRGKQDAFDFVCGKFDLDWSFNKMNDVTDALALALYSHQTLSEV